MKLACHQTIQSTSALRAAAVSPGAAGFLKVLTAGEGGGSVQRYLGVKGSSPRSVSRLLQGSRLCCEKF